MSETEIKQQGSGRDPREYWRRWQAVFKEYPGQFWVLTLSVFVDRVGGGMLFPFFSLYITRKFRVGLTEVGLIFAIFSVAGLVSSLVGGALADRMGRKGIMIFSLVMSATSALLMGFVNDFGIFLGAAGLVGLLSEVGMPAQQAMVADLLPEEKRAQAYGILRVAVNLAVVIGPALGGFMAARSYLLIFMADAVTSTVTALIVYFAIRETYHPPIKEGKQESLGGTLRGYGTALRDRVFTWFLLGTMLSVLIYMQMTSTLPVFLRDEYGITERLFGTMMSINAGLVVLFQFPITRWSSRFRPMMVMAGGTLLYALGFVSYGFVGSFALFILAMVVVTMGEMLVVPVAQSVVGRLSPEDMRGRYMAAYGLSWVLPSAVGPLLAGLVMDAFDPRWVWYACGVIGVLSALTFYLIQSKAERARWTVLEERVGILERMENGEISAKEGVLLIQGVKESHWRAIGGNMNPAAEQTKNAPIEMGE